MLKKKVLILGGGFGGLTAARCLEKEPVEITLIDKMNHHLFQPLLYQVATAGLAAPAIAQPIRCIVSASKNVTTYLDEVKAIDLPNKLVVCEQRTYAYDYLIIALGAKTGYFGHDQWSRYTHGLKTLEDALQIRREVLAAFEQAEMETDPFEQRRLMTMVVVGGGATGVEMAGALAELGRLVLKDNFRHIDPTKVRVVLIEAGPRLLSSFPQHLSDEALRQVRDLGVEVHLNAPVRDIQQGVVTLDKEKISTNSIIWAAGVEGIPLLRNLGVPVDHTGRLLVDPDCSLPGFPHTFAVGDCTHLTDRNGNRVPGVSPAAIQMAEHVTRIIHREMAAGDKPFPEREPFGYFDKGSMATIGRSRAIAKLGPLEFTGFIAWMTWLLVHLLFLIGLRNKVGVVIDWVYSYFTFKRGSRIIVG